MSAIEPTPTTMAALAALNQDEGPVAMINLLRYNERASYPEGSAHTPCSGREAYLRYGAEVQVHLEKVGGEVVWRATALLAWIAPEGERWDEAIIARYPSVGAFLWMISASGYRQIAIHRRAALADARLLVTRPGP